MRGLFILVLSALLLAACAGKRLARAWAPARCIQRIRWTKPCEQIAGDLYRCDAVEVVASCVTYVEPK